MEPRSLRQTSVLLMLGCAMAACGGPNVEISVSPTSAATGRDGVEIVVEARGGGPLAASQLIRFAGREIATQYRPADGALVGVLTSTDLAMRTTDPDEKAVEVVAVEGATGEPASKATRFLVRRRYRFGAPMTIASFAKEGDFAKPMDTLKVIASSAQSLLVSWKSREWLEGVTSSDGGVTWSKPDKIYHVSDSQPYFLDAVAPDKLLLLYRGGGQLLATVSQDHGATWASPVAVVGDADAFAARRDPRGHLDLTWTQGYDVDRIGTTLYSRSTDGGTTWSPSQLVADRVNGWVDGIVGDATGRVMLCTVYQNGRYPGYECFSKASPGSAWTTSQIGPDDRDHSLVLDDGTLLMGGAAMFRPYSYTPNVVRTPDWGSTWVSKSYDEEYDGGSVNGLVSAGPDSLALIIRSSRAGVVVLRSFDTGVSWGHASDPVKSENWEMATAGCADGSLLVVGWDGSALSIMRAE